MEAVADNRFSEVLVIGLTFLVGMVLTVMPLPSFIPPEIGYLRPDWVAMVLIYWVLALPHRIGIATAWFVGIVMDVLLGSLFGQQALAFVIVAYLVTSLYQRLRMFTIWQQALVLFAILGVNKLIYFWIESIVDSADWSMWRLLPAVSGALLWPWVFMTLRYLRRRAKMT